MISDDGSVSGTDRLISRLAIRSKSFHKSTRQEREGLAKAVLKKLQADEWSTAGDWVCEAVKVEKLSLASDPETKNLGAAMRFIMGSAVKSWLTTFVAASSSSSSVGAVPSTAVAAATSVVLVQDTIKIGKQLQHLA